MCMYVYVCVCMYDVYVCVCVYYKCLNLFKYVPIFLYANKNIFTSQICK